MGNIKGVLILDTVNLLGNPGIKKIHMIGIGGISMSGLSEILLNLGYTISGSDIGLSNTVSRLASKGIRVYREHSAENVIGSDLVVYTSAIREDNPEYIKARELGIPVMDRATLLGQIMKMYPFSIAVSGCHGKTTTTSMISSVMLNAGMDPTIHVGGELKAISGNTRIGGSKYFITEACEYMENFLKFNPYIAVILNIEEDHLDYFRDIEHIQEAFYKFALRIAPDGYLIGCADDDRVRGILDKVGCNKITYGIRHSSAVIQAANISFDGCGSACFDVYREGAFYEKIKLSIPGFHNIYNALAAIAVCTVANVDKNCIRQSLADFSGADRRFETKGTRKGIKVIDDYAHHPSEIKATLSAAKNVPHSRVWCVFQPHTYTRTLALLDEFTTAFADADKVVITDIYAAREKDTGLIHSRILAEKVAQTGKDCIYLSSFDSVVDYLNGNAMEGDIVLTMGAGDIYKVGEMFLQLGEIAQNC